MAAFFSHQAIIDVGTWKGSSMEFQTIEGEKERAAFFASTLACALTPSSFAFRLLFLLLPYLIGVLFLIMVWVCVGQDDVNNFGILRIRAHTHTHTKMCDTLETQCFIAVAPVSRVVSCENYGTYFNKMFQVNNKK